MTENEIVRTFIKAHDPPYFEEIFRMTGSSFADIINKLEEYDEFVRAGKIVNISALKSQVEALQGNNAKKPLFKRKEGETALVWEQGPSFRPKSHHVSYPFYHPQPVYHTTAQNSHPRPINLNVPTMLPPPQPIIPNYPRPYYNPRPNPQIANPIQNPFRPSTSQTQRQSRSFTNLGRPIE